MNTKRNGRSEFFKVEGTGRVYQVSDLTATRNSMGQTQSYLFFQLECAGTPEGETARQPLRIRCTAWDNFTSQAASELQGLPNRTPVRITGYMDPWFQLWGPNGKPEGMQIPIPNGGQENGHARPWETISLVKGAAILETAQLTITEVEVLASTSDSESTEPSNASTETSMMNMLKSANGKVEDSTLGKTAAIPQKKVAANNHDSSNDYLKVIGTVTATEQSKVLMKEGIPHKTFRGVANQDYTSSGMVVQQQPIRLKCNLSGEVALQTEKWEDETPIELEGWLKPLNLLHNPQEDITIEIPGAGEEGGHSRPWELIYSPSWNPNLCIIPTFQVITESISKIDDKVIAEGGKAEKVLLEENALTSMLSQVTNTTPSREQPITSETPSSDPPIADPTAGEWDKVDDVPM